MNLTHRLTTLAALAVFGGSAQAALTADTPLCGNGSAAALMGAVSCSGAWDGNDLNQTADVLAQLNLDFADEVGVSGLWNYVGSTNAGDSVGPFSSVPVESSSGTLSFDSVVKGYFVVALKSGTNFSFYLFDGGMDGVSSINFTTRGTSLNPNNNKAQALSHVSLYTAPVPEPETYALMLAGLGITALAIRRRKSS